jgi:hypothetical protein
MAEPVRIMGSNCIQAEVNDEGRLDVVQHAHPNNAHLHFRAVGLVASQDFILLDISDTTNYPHINTNYVHIENMRVHTDVSASADYSVEIGYLENVDGSNGDFFSISDVIGSQVAGRSQDIIFPFYPNNPRCSSDFVVSSVKSLNDTAFQTDVNLASTLDPTTVDTPSGNGDLVVRFIRLSGTVSVDVELSYHTHDGGL